MASRIAGITVEIGGDTTKLSKALESVNKTIKTTQAELKDVNKLLKLDPSNTEAVTQKQRMLKEAIEATKEKLTTLKTAAEQANQQLADGKITQDQYDALQREIVETEQNLKSLQEQAAVTNTTLAKIDAVGEKLQTVGSQVEGVGKKFLPVTAAVTGLGTAAVKTAADFDQEMSKVAAISGATGSDFDALREKAREMGAKTKFSASEAASAMEYMAMAGWKTGDMLDGIEGIMNLAAASGEDLATTSDIVTDALTAFGLSASDSGHFADILAAASSNANTNVSMMGETFKYCAPIAGALGFSAEDTAEAIGLMANSGIKASQAGTSLRSIMNNLAGEVTFAGKNIGEVTIATSNADGSMRSLNDILADCRVAFSGLTESEKAANAESLVGKNAMSGFLALMNSGEGDINKLRGAIENCDGSAESMAETMQDNLNGQCHGQGQRCRHDHGADPVVRRQECAGFQILAGIVLLEIAGEAHTLESRIVSDQGHIAVLEIIQKLLRKGITRCEVCQLRFAKAAALVRCPGNQKDLEAGVGNIAVQTAFLDVCLTVGFNVDQCLFQSSSPRFFSM